MTDTKVLTAADRTLRIETIANEFDIWRKDNETDTELADRTILSLDISIHELDDYIVELRELIYQSGDV